ncbi:hypothetical protein AC630_13180 [Bradyrhizobium sp. AS23.2]|nr:hypothetical protein AC630_13180 [Bradyrhizobium sp. AS23.2]
MGNWRVELIEAHRDLFSPPCDTALAAQGAPECGSGWHDLLDRMCVRIRTAIRAGGTFKFSQIKEKYGTLRVYWEGRLSAEKTIQVEEAIALAEARSATCCEVRGDPGRLHGDDWLTTRCATHAEAVLHALLGERRRREARRRPARGPRQDCQYEELSQRFKESPDALRNQADAVRSEVDQRHL